MYRWHYEINMFQSNPYKNDYKDNDDKKYNLSCK